MDRRQRGRIVFKIINRANGLRLGVDTGNANGSVMELWADRSNLSQQWQFVAP